MSLTPNQRAEFEELIAARKASLLSRLGATQAQLSDIRLARSDGTADDEHDPEGSTLSTEWSRAEGQREDAVRELGDLESAGERLAGGTYGYCARCGGEIPLERLRLLPSSVHCVPCASAVAAGR